MNDIWEDLYDSWKTATPPEYSGHGALPKPKPIRCCEACGHTFTVRYADQTDCGSQCLGRGAR